MTPQTPQTCPACAEKRRHAPEDWRAFHPLAGHGYQSGQGWSHPELAALAEVQRNG